MTTCELVFDAPASGDVVRIQEALREQGYARSNDATLGLPPDLHKHISKTFYADNVLGPEVPGMVPADRLRARDVLQYQRLSTQIALSPHADIAMPPRVDATEPRIYKRVDTLTDPPFVDWIITLLSLVPPEERSNQGILGLNFLRSFRDVVAHKHQDEERFVGVYVAAREAAGAVTTLHPVDRPDHTVDDTRDPLLPGDWLVFRDKDFLHDVTPIEPRHDGDTPYRDAIVALIHYPTVSIHRADNID